MENTKVRKVFCAAEQKETNHRIDITDNGEIMLTCINNLGTEDVPSLCGRFLKFPKGTDIETLKAKLEEHKTVNSGQVTVESMEAVKDEIANALAE